MSMPEPSMERALPQQEVRRTPMPPAVSRAPVTVHLVMKFMGVLFVCSGRVSSAKSRSGDLTESHPRP